MSITASAYISLFLVSFAAATLLPAQSELVLAGLLASGRFDDTWLLIVATAGNTLGSAVNWLLGRFIGTFRERRWLPVSPTALVRAEAWYRRWGLWTLLLSWAPVIGDGLTVVAGVLRVRLLPFLALVLIAKGGRYLVVAYAVQATAGP